MLLFLWYNKYGDTMDILKQLFHEKEIEKLLEEEPNLKYMDKKDARNIIKILTENKCSNRVLRSLILRNPSFLLRKYSEIKELIDIILEYGIENIDMMFYIYPNILNKSAYEIDNFFIKKHQQGLSNDLICDILEVEPFQIDELEKI